MKKRVKAKSNSRSSAKFKAGTKSKGATAKKKQQALDRRLLNLANESIDKIKGKFNQAKQRFEHDVSSVLAMSILNKAKNIRENLNKKRRATRSTKTRK